MNQFAAESKGSSYWLGGYVFGGGFLCTFFFSWKQSLDYKRPLLLSSLRFQRETAFSWQLRMSTFFKNGHLPPMASQGAPRWLHSSERKLS